MLQVDLQCDWLEEVDLGTQSLPDLESRGESSFWVRNYSLPH